MRWAALFVLCALPVRAQEGVAEGEAHARRLRPAEGLKVASWAAEPQVRNPVALSMDEKGRLFVVETHRYRTSALDIRQSMKWFEDDLACRTVKDRERMIRKWMGADAAKLAKESERIRVLEDRDGDGRAEHAATFAEGFSTMTDGTAAGVLARRGEVYFANVPNLWLLRDQNGDGKADQRRVVHTGFGVRFSFAGHDLHGLAFGPDGKLYFSVGDRGFSVVTAEGTRLEYPDMGATLRCDPDGTQLEVFAIGHRNAQELVFDDHGNLWTGDNDADVDDEARWVYVVEGGDSGWRVGYQHSSERWGAPEPGADAAPAAGRDSLWITEELWKGNAPYVVPPVGFLGGGPAGVAWYPGTGLPERYAGRFFVCEFPGGVRSFAVKPKGASFEVVDSQKFLWEGRPTDAEFGPDGALYVSDWGESREKSGKGGIFRVSDPASEKSPAVAEVRLLLAEGMAKRSFDDLGKLLGHRDQRVRMAAQFELVGRQGSTQKLAEVARSSPQQLARLHAIWGLGQLYTRSPLFPLLQDPDPEIRAQTARVLGDKRVDQGYEALVPLLKDANPRVRYHAALAVGKIGRAEAMLPVLEMLRENGDRDPYLRHAGVMALALIGNGGQLVKEVKEASAPVRLAAILALRRMGRADLRTFLADPDPALAFEAARGIHDLPVPEAMEALADLLAKPRCPPKAVLRAINANFRLGKALSLAAFAARPDAPAAARVEALRALAAWERPNGRDRVTGLWRPLPPREPGPAREALAPVLPEILRSAPEEIRAEAARTAAILGLK